MAIGTEHDCCKGINLLRNLALTCPYKSDWSDVLSAELSWMMRHTDDGSPVPIPVPCIISGYLDYDERRFQSMIFLNKEMQPQPFRRNCIRIDMLDAIPKSWSRKSWTLILCNLADSDTWDGGNILRIWYQQEGFHYD